MKNKITSPILAFLVFVLIVLVGCNQTNRETKEKPSSDQVVEMTATIHIGGMHCANCVASVEKGVNQLEGIHEVKVSLSDSTAVVKYLSSEVELKQIEGAIEKRGYSIKNQ